MKIYLSSLEQQWQPAKELIIKNCTDLQWILCSFFYIKDMATFNRIKGKCQNILIDSGAHSFQKGKKVDWLEYTKKYAQFIKDNDCDKIVGYFEMDVDNIIGYDNVLKLRKILESVSDKIIPVWHKNRGIEDFIKMCKVYEGKWIAITGFKNEDIKDEQYAMFLRTAWKYGCKVHCLGMTRKSILNKIPFDSVDSSSWAQHVAYGKIGNKHINKNYQRANLAKCFERSFQYYLKLAQEHYKKWKKYE